VPTRFVNPYHSSKHGNEEFVYFFNLAIGIWVIGRLVFMAKTQLFSELGHHEVSKVATVINNDSLRNTKMSNDMIEYE
jgi:hypothetical protein